MSALHVYFDESSSMQDAPDPDYFTQWAKAFDSIHTHSASLALRLVGVEEMSQLNHQFRGKDGPTNVLSFCAELDEHLSANAEDELIFLGDIAICSPVVQQESKAQGKTAEQHWAHLFVHGVLHLLGFDHQSDDEAAEMEQLETTLLASLNYPAPYEH